MIHGYKDMEHCRFKSEAAGTYCEGCDDLDELLNHQRDEFRRYMAVGDGPRNDDLAIWETGGDPLRFKLVYLFAFTDGVLREYDFRVPQPDLQVA